MVLEPSLNTLRSRAAIRRERIIITYGEVMTRTPINVQLIVSCVFVDGVIIYMYADFIVVEIVSCLM
jgi:hypothetical protein